MSNAFGIVFMPYDKIDDEGVPLIMSFISLNVIKKYKVKAAEKKNKSFKNNLFSNLIRLIIAKTGKIFNIEANKIIIGLINLFEMKHNDNENKKNINKSILPLSMPSIVAGEKNPSNNATAVIIVSLILFTNKRKPKINREIFMIPKYMA